VCTKFYFWLPLPASGVRAGLMPTSDARVGCDQLEKEICEKRCQRELKMSYSLLVDRLSDVID